MLQVARLSPRLLGESAELVAGFLKGQLHPDGGFRDRSGAADLYYTVFGLEGLLALQQPLPVEATRTYLAGFGGGEDLDLVHLGCLARSWACLPAALRCDVPREEIGRRIEEFRSADGAFHIERGAEHGSLYGCFVAFGAYQDLDLPLGGEREAGILGCIDHLRAEDGGYANQADLPLGLTPATTAAVTLLRHLGRPPELALGEWLLARCAPGGGFFATPMAPLPDLLSTATALHALGSLPVSLDRIREPCLDFVDSLWTNRGGFYGHWQDDAIDCEYTYYALLALGHLSL
jgi:prenyltransferase beta subunit